MPLPTMYPAMCPECHSALRPALRPARPQRRRRLPLSHTPEPTVLHVELYDLSNSGLILKLIMSRSRVYQSRLASPQPVEDQCPSPGCCAIRSRARRGGRHPPLLCGDSVNGTASGSESRAVGSGLRYYTVKNRDTRMLRIHGSIQLQRV